MFAKKEIVVVIAVYAEILQNERRRENNVEENGLPISWTIIAVIVFIFGIILFEKTLPKNRTLPWDDSSTTQSHS